VQLAEQMEVMDEKNGTTSEVTITSVNTNFDEMLQNEQDSVVVVEEDESITSQGLENIIVQWFSQRWGNVVSSVNALDRLFGTNNGLLDIENNGNDLNNTAGNGFGFDDGIWEHTGWNVIPKLQYHISELSELRCLMNSIGRRSTVQASTTSMHKFRPRKLDQNGGIGATEDVLVRSSVSGLTLSNSFTEMVPSEAVLLRGSPALRRLFLAKKVESKLLSYQMLGWTDTASIETRKYRTSTPSGPGGPIILCLGKLVIAISVPALSL
jgi:hypothetical protein